MVLEARFPIRKEVSDFKKKLIESAKTGTKRNLIEDGSPVLERVGITWDVKYRQNPIPDRPTIVAANHYVRGPFERMSLQLPEALISSTMESYKSTVIISKAVEPLRPQKKIRWSAQIDIKDHFLSFELPDPKMQKLAIDVYNFIPVTSKNGLTFLRHCLATLQEGIDIGIYPEGKAGQSMKIYKKGFDRLLSYLMKSIDFQILPVSFIDMGGEHYNVVVNEVLHPEQGKNAEQFADQLMRIIALRLPISRQGQYFDLF